MKKGLEFLSNRIVVSIILIIIQIIAILIFAYTLFIDLWVFKIIFMMLSFLVVFYIINKDDDPSYKIIWLVPILSFPVFGGVLYLAFGNKKPAKKLQIAFDKQSKATNPYIYPNHVLEEIDDPIIKGQIKYLVNENFPVYNNSEIKYYSLGELDEGIFEKDDVEQLLSKVIDSLPERCREIFLKSKIEGKKQKEIAEEMNISINTVETQMGIAYKKLRNELKDYFPLFIFLYYL